MTADDFNYDCGDSDSLVFEAYRVGALVDFLADGVLLHIADSAYPALVELGSVDEALYVVRQLAGEDNEIE